MSVGLLFFRWWGQLKAVFWTMLCSSPVVYLLAHLMDLKKQSDQITSTPTPSKVKPWVLMVILDEEKISVGWSHEHQFISTTRHPDDYQSKIINSLLILRKILRFQSHQILGFVVAGPGNFKYHVIQHRLFPLQLQQILDLDPPQTIIGYSPSDLCHHKVFAQVKNFPFLVLEKRAQEK